MNAVVLGRSEIAARLPYGDAFLFVDEVLALENGRRIVTAARYDPEQPWIDAHFAAGPKLLPGVLIVEQACQSALLLGSLSEDARQGSRDRGRRFVVGRVKATFAKPVTCPCRLQIDLTLAVARSDSIGFVAVAYDGEEQVATVQGAAGVMPPEIAA